MPFARRRLESVDRRSLLGNVLSRACAVVTLLLAALGAPSASAQTYPGPELRVLRSFAEADGVNRGEGPLVQASDGLIYGVRRNGGAANRGVVFRFALDGTGFQVIRSVGATEDLWPVAIVPSGDGALYGTTDGSNQNAEGSVFKINRDGSGFAVLHRFTDSTVASRPGMLLEGRDGFLYGSCYGPRGATESATPLAIFKIGRDGTGFQVIRTLAAAEGRGQGLALVQAGDGRLYGAAQFGGASDAGTLFRVNTDGTGFAVLKTFGGTDGSRPTGLVVTRSGRMFGTTYTGGAIEGSLGTIFRLDADGSNFTLLHSLRVNYPPPVRSQMPVGRLVEGFDGMLYGVSHRGGLSSEWGTLYRVNPADGAYTLMRVFTSTNGAFPTGDLVSASNGRIYGTTNTGGANGIGVIFQFASAAPNFQPEAAIGQAFSYPASAIFGVAATYFASGLPLGLSIDDATGDITGIAREGGFYPISLSANGVGGLAGPVTVMLNVTQAKATVVLSDLQHVYDGRPKPATVTTTPPGLSVTVTYDGSPTAPVLPGRYAVTATISHASYSGSASGTLVISSGSLAVTLPASTYTRVAGESLTLTAGVTGAGPFTYQWQRKTSGASAFADLQDADGVAGAASVSLALSAVTFAMTGDQFRLVVTGASGSATSEPITLTVHPAAVLRNVAIRARVGSGEPLTVGFVTTGERPVLIRGIGPGLAPFLGDGVAIAADPSLTLTNSGNVRLATNDNWGGVAALVTAFVNAGAFALPPASHDAALLVPVNGAATAQMTVTNSGIGLVEVYDAGTGPAVRVANLSALYHVGRDADALVAGFTVSGTGNKRLLIRGAGPALQAFGVAGVLADPRIEIFTASGASLVGSDDWVASLAPTFAEAGAFAFTASSKDAALAANLPAGSYTVRLSGADGGTGTGLIEIYELP